MNGEISVVDAYREACTALGELVVGHRFELGELRAQLAAAEADKALLAARVEQLETDAASTT